MSESPLEVFLAELRRRKVYRTAVGYAAVGFVLWQVAEIAVPALGMPEWVLTFVVVGTLVGFPVAVVMAWFLELRREVPARAPARVSARQLLADEAFRRRLLILVCAGAAVLVVTVAIVSLARPGTAAILQEGATVVLADFTSTEGDEDIAVAIRQALRVDLEHSGYVAVVTPGAVQSALRRMERPLDVRVTPEVAQEIALRDGYAAVLGGEVVSGGTGWLVTLRLTRMLEGGSDISDRETLADSSDVLPGVNRLSRRFRDRVGESATSLRASPPLPELTTQSLAALQAVAKALQAVTRGEDARVYYHEALAADSGFVTARAMVALLSTLANPRPLPEAIRLLEEVYPERDRLTPAERVGFLWAFHRIVHNDLEASTRVVADYLEGRPDALEDFQWLLVLDAVGRNQFELAETLLLELKERSGSLVFGMRHNLEGVWMRLGKYDKVDSALAVHPEDLRMAVRGLMFREEWASAAQRMGAARDRNPFEEAFGPMVMALVRGQISDFYRHAARVEQLFVDQGEPDHAAAWDLAFRRTIQLTLEGDTSRAVAGTIDVADRFPPDGSVTRAVLRLELAELEAMAGLTARAREHLADFDDLHDEPARRVVSADRLVIEGRILRVEGSPEESLRLLRRVRDMPRLPNSSVHYALGETYDALSEPDSAAAAYETFLATHWFGGNFRSDRHWRLRYLAVAHERLGQLYEQLDRPADAARHYEKFVADWADADDVLQPRVQTAREALERLRQ